jgi:hypothetical protein
MFRPCRYIVRLALVLAACGLFAACGPSAQQTPTTVPTVPSTVAGTSQVPGATAPAVGAATPPALTAAGDAAILASIQQTLDLYARAYNEDNVEFLKQAVDQENAPFKRFMQTTFEQTTDRGTTAQQRHYTALALLKHLPYGFVLARVGRVGVGATAGVTDVTFRTVNSHWLMSEPTEAQIGAREQIESAHFTIITYPWIDDINPKIVTILEQARTNVLNSLGKAADKTTVHVRPIFGLGSPVASDATAYYNPDRKGGIQIEVFAPGSYSFRFYDPAQGWEKKLEGALTHEYTHLVTDQLIIPLGRMSDWMSEGLAEYVSDARHTETLRDMVQSNRIIPLRDTSAPILERRDLEHWNALLQDASERYGMAYSLVAYIVDRYGGLDGFWKFVRAYDKAQDLDKALQQAFGIDYTQFDKDWRAWLKATYS